MTRYPEESTIFSHNYLIKVKGRGDSSLALSNYITLLSRFSYIKTTPFCQANLGSCHLLYKKQEMEFPSPKIFASCFGPCPSSNYYMDTVQSWHRLLSRFIRGGALTRPTQIDVGLRHGGALFVFKILLLMKPLKISIKD